MRNMMALDTAGIQFVARYILCFISYHFFIFIFYRFDYFKFVFPFINFSYYFSIFSLIFIKYSRLGNDLTLFDEMVDLLSPSMTDGEMW